MYICVCNAVTDRQVKKCIDQGMHSVGRIKKHFEFGSCCGKCSCHIRELIDQHATATPLVSIKTPPTADRHITQNLQETM